MKAIWNDTVIAQSDDTIVIEGNHYFPPQDVKDQYLKSSEKTYTCPWKGHADYFHLDVEGEKNPNAAWVYPEPKEAAQEIAGYLAFSNGVKVTESG